MRPENLMYLDSLSKEDLAVVKTKHNLEGDNLIDLFEDSLSKEIKFDYRLKKINYVKNPIFSSNYLKSFHTLSYVFISNDFKVECKPKLSTEGFPLIDLFSIKSYIVKTKDDEHTVQKKYFLGDEVLPKSLKQKFEKQDYLNTHFFIYDAKVNDVEYKLLSKKKLGTDVILSGQKLIMKEGFKKLLSNNVEVIIVNTFENRIKKLSIDELKALLKKEGIDSFEKLKDFVFRNPKDNTIVRHTKFLSDSLIYCLFSSIRSGVPLHLMVFGEFSTGKTFIAKQISYKIGEPIIQGAKSTLKGLIPSHTVGKENAGALQNSERVCMIDDLIKMAEKETRNMSIAERGNYFGAFNDYLSRDGAISVAATSKFISDPTSKAIIITNPMSNTTELVQNLDLVDTSTVSRFLPIIVGEDEKEKVIAETRDIGEEYPLKHDDYLFLTIFDSLNNIDSTLDRKIIYAIIKDLEVQFQQFDEPKLNNLFVSRLYVSATLVCDAIVKMRYLFDGGELIGTKEDYNVFKDYMKKVIFRWTKKSIGFKKVEKTSIYSYGESQ